MYPLGLGPTGVSAGQCNPWATREWFFVVFRFVSGIIVVLLFNPYGVRSKVVNLRSRKTPLKHHAINRVNKK